MDYGTFFFTNIASVAVLTLCVCLLALYNRRVTGMKWLAGGLVVGLAKMILQGVEGKVSPELSNMPANGLYLISFMMQLVGLRWFVVRKPLRSWWPWIAIGLVLVVYIILFLEKIPYSANVINIPFVVVCGASAWILLKHGTGPFTAVSRVSAVILCGEMGLAAYRAVLTDLFYKRPWETELAESDPQWLYSLAGMAILATFMVMCYLWFLVTELQRELAALARTDPLTGALNRRVIEEAVLHETARSIRYGYPLCMIMIDIDHFKRLNDTRGHSAGDCALKVFVAKTRTLLRRQDLFARTGGDEFTILLPDSPESAGILTAERVRQTVETLEIPFEKKPLQFTISAGVAQLDPAHDGTEGMMQRADAALYKAKENGRNSVSALSPVIAMPAFSPDSLGNK
jgi:diguanylate cyclase (GGDEF)-like protein